jgi:C1A family cysteine protease
VSNFSEDVTRQNTKSATRNMRALLFTFALAAASLVDIDTKKEFLEFVEKYDKNYDAAELRRREIIFARKKIERDVHNEKYRQGKIGWSVGLSHFSDLDHHEIAFSAGRDTTFKTMFNDVTPFTTFHSSIEVNMMRNSSHDINWVTRGKVSPIKDQMPCGACSKFASVAAVESCLAISNDIPPPDLSEQHIQVSIYLYFSSSFS